MSKKIFTKLFTGIRPVAILTQGSAPAIHQWLMQEDIEVIGASIMVASSLPSENDGYATCEIELSQVGVSDSDGSLLKASSGEGWNTAPPGICRQNAHIVAMFPSGEAVPIKEEGYLFVNAWVVAKSAGTSEFRYTVIVYYTKGRSR
ncbi:hypothetical protein ES708_29497 [subsurface metagenome]